MILQDAMRSLVGNVDQFGRIVPASQMGDWVTVYAPGRGWGLSPPHAARMPNALVPYVVDQVTSDVEQTARYFSGTSFCKMISFRTMAISSTNTFRKLPHA